MRKYAAKCKYQITFQPIAFYLNILRRTIFSKFNFYSKFLLLWTRKYVASIFKILEKYFETKYNFQKYILNLLR